MSEHPDPTAPADVRAALAFAQQLEQMSPESLARMNAKRVVVLDWLRELGDLLPDLAAPLPRLVGEVAQRAASLHGVLPAHKLAELAELIQDANREIVRELRALCFELPGEAMSLEDWIELARVIERDPKGLTLEDIRKEAIAFFERERVRERIRAQLSAPPVAPAAVAWTPTLGVQEWARVLGVERVTASKRLHKWQAEGRAEAISLRSWRIDRQLLNEGQLGDVLAADATRRQPKGQRRPRKGG